MRIPKHNKDPRQLRLGRTRDNQLILLRGKGQLPPNLLVRYKGDVELQAELPFHRSTNEELYLALRPPFLILKLPEEIVEHILMYAHYNLCNERRLWKQRYSNISEWERRRVGLSICIISRYFYRLMHPFIYSSQSIYINHADYGIKISGNPHITNHCTNLTIYINGPLKDLLWPNENFFNKYSNVRTLRLEYGRFDVGDALEMRRRISSHFPRLEHIDFDIEHVKYSDPDWTKPDELTFPVLYEALGPQPRLKSLKVFEITPTLPSISTQKTVSMATFTSLEIYRCSGPPLSLTNILRWPTRLEHLNIRDINVPSRETSYLSQFESILYAHGQSLTSLGLPNFFDFPLGNPPDLSTLAHLQVVSIADHGRYPRIWSAEAFCTYVLSAPRLRKLTWDFSIWDCEYGALNMDFVAGHAKWLIDVAHLARAQRRSLREIEIVFTPGLGYYTKKPDLAPWKLMDHAARVLSGLGMVLLYKRHLLTKMKQFNNDIQFELLTHEPITITGYPPSWGATIRRRNEGSTDHRRCLFAQILMPCQSLLQNWKESDTLSRTPLMLSAEQQLRPMASSLVVSIIAPGQEGQSMSFCGICCVSSEEDFSDCVDE